MIIRPLEYNDISIVNEWSNNEGFSPGIGDVNIYRSTDREGIWIGSLDNHPIGCIAGIRYNESYGFIGLFIVTQKHRGNGYGLQLWKHALLHLENIPCIGLEAALDRVDDYSSWGFKASSITTRWHINSSRTNLPFKDLISDLLILKDDQIPSKAIQYYDAKREPTPRPHFLSYWLNHSSGSVLALVDKDGNCHGFGRIRPCLMTKGSGWRIGPLLADNSYLAELLLSRLLSSHSGNILIDSPGLNPNAKKLFVDLGFNEVSHTYRMYKGEQPPISLEEVYGLACLELG